MSGAAFPLIKVSKASMSDSNLLTNLLDASPCESHLVGAALRSFRFFSSTAVYAALNTEAFTVEYFISFQMEIIIASTSIKVLYFGNR